MCDSPPHSQCFMCGFLAVEAIIARTGFSKGPAHCTSNGNWAVESYHGQVVLQQSNDNPSCWDLDCRGAIATYDISGPHGTAPLQLALEREAMRQEMDSADRSA